MIIEDVIQDVISDPIQDIIGLSGLDKRLIKNLVESTNEVLSFNRVSVETIIDFDGKSIPILTQESGFTGARRIQNIFADSIDLNGVAWVTTLTGTATVSFNVGNTIATLSCPNVGDRAYLSANFTTIAARQYRASFNHNVISGTPSGATVLMTGGQDQNGLVTIISSGRAQADIITDALGLAGGIRIGLGASSGVTSPCVISISAPQLEDVTGQRNINSGEYVSTIDHGANVNNVQWFDRALRSESALNIVNPISDLLYPATNEYLYKLENLTDFAVPRAINDPTIRKSVSWTNYVYNDTLGGSHVFSGVSDSIVDLIAPTSGSSRAICNLSFDLVAGQSYAISVEVLQCINSGAASNTRQLTSGSAATSGDKFVDVPNGATGRWGYRFTASATETVNIRFGAGANAAVSSSSSVLITKPMVENLSTLVAPFSPYTDFPFGVKTIGGFDFSLGDSGQVISADNISTVRTSVSPYSFGLGVGDSFANDSAEWPQRIQVRSFTGTFHGKGYPGDQITGIIGSTFLDNLSAYNYTFAAIQGGINDIRGGGKTADVVLAGIKSMVATARSRGVYPMIINVAPWKNDAVWTASLQIVTDEYNAALLTYCVENSIPNIDIYALLEGPADELAAVYDSGDGLHPNQAGSELIADAVIAQIPSNPLSGILLASTSILSYPNDPIPINDFTVELSATPNTANATVYLWSSYVNASNYVGILHNGVNLIARSRVAGSNADANFPLPTLDIGTRYDVKATYSATNGIDIMVNGVLGTNNSNVSDRLLGATAQVGTLNGANDFLGSIKNLKVT